jgi:hypothetical protein
MCFAMLCQACCQFHSIALIADAAATFSGVACVSPRQSVLWPAYHPDRACCGLRVTST